MRIVVTGGGTAGHISPVLAVVDALGQLDSDIDILYVGQRHGVEGRMAREAGLSFAGISAGKYRRVPHAGIVRNLADLHSTALNLRDVGLTAAGVAQSLRVLRRFKPDVVFAKGGFVALPVATAARLLNIPVVAHESDVVPGIGSKVVSKWAAVMAVGFPEELYGDRLGSHLRFTGNPVRRELLQGEAKRGLEAAFGRAKSGKKAAGSDPVVLVVGGSQGAQAINHALVTALPQLTQRYRVIHICGSRNYAAVQAQVKELGLPAGRYAAKDFVAAKELADLYAASSMVVSRAGANTIAELAALKKPVLLIPNSAAAAHQLVNAERLHQAGAVALLSEEGLTGEELADTITELLSKPKRLQQLADKLADFNVPDAANRIAEAIVEQVSD